VKQRKPMSRGKGFARAELPKRHRAPLVSLEPRPGVRMSQSSQEAVHQAPKFEYIRDKRLRKMCQAMPCQICGSGGSDWAHSNLAEHGKGKSIKASDIYVAALCWPCHSAIDQGNEYLRENRVAAWVIAHKLTLEAAIREGRWPEGVPLPDWIYQSTAVIAIDQIK
jgi:hypothetical protein